MDQRKTDLLESQLLVEKLEQREQMLEAQIEMLQVQDNILMLLWELSTMAETSRTLLLTCNQSDGAITKWYRCVLVDGER